MTRGAQGRSDRGAALILTVAWSAVLLMLAGVVSAAVLRQIRPSDEAEASFQAWAAAEAGVDDARARLSADGEYWKDVAAFNADPVGNAGVSDANPALAGWVDLPGGESTAQLTYFLDVSGAEEYGRIRVTSSGRATPNDDAIVRTVDVLIQKRVSTDYAYLSNSEAFPFDLPGAYGTKNGNDGTSQTSPEVAKELCVTGGDGQPATYWYQWQPWPGHAEGGPKTSSSLTDPAAIAYGADHRNSYACLHGVVSTDSGGGEEKGAYFEGPAHTNDVWYVDDSKIDNIAGVFNGRVTSSCPDGVCPADHRWLSSSTSGGNSGEVGGGGDPDTYVIDEVGSGNLNTPWNPEYEPILEMPSDTQLAALREVAVTSGCVFSGPTRIRFRTESDGSGKVDITSPDTVDGSTNSWCGTGYFATNPASQATITLDYDDMVQAGFNGVLSVVEAAEDARPSCEVKAVDPRGKADYSNYPWVIPQGESSTLGIVNSDPIRGLPDVETYFKGKTKKDTFDAWTDSPDVQCAKGHVYLEAPAGSGGYTGRYTIAADGDIVITDDVYEATATARTSYTDPDWGVPDETSDNQLGLIPDRWLYVYHLAGALGGNQNGIDAQLSYLLLDFAVLAKDKCLAVQDYTSLPSLKDLKIVGALGQNSRCRVTDGSSGYNGAFKIVYDNRYKRLGPPPFMPILSQEPWQARSWSETTVRRDAEAKSGIPALQGAQSKGTSFTYGVVAGAPEGTDLLYARISSGVGSVTASPENGTVTYTAPDGVEHTIVEFVVRKPDGTRVGQTITIDVS